VSIFKVVNLRGDLFATIASFSAQAFIKLGSSLILTRILRPEAYGVITILISILFVVEMLSDIAVIVSVVRHKDGDDPSYLNTAWTMRLVRATFNTAIVFVLAPWIASLYSTPSLTTPLRVFCAYFLISAFESMAFPLAIRRKNTRIVVYSELTALIVSTAVSVGYSYYSRDYWGMVYGTLANRLTITIMSYQFYRDSRPRLFFDRNAAQDLLRYARYSMPSSLLTLALTQFDKVVFLRLFDLKLLGVYGVAGNIAGPVESLITKISQLVLYPRCAHNYRDNPATFPTRYYTENKKLFATILILPALVGGLAPILISVLYDPRYIRAGFVLQAFMLRAQLLALASPAEDMLIAAGESHILLYGNIFRAAWMFAGSLTGYYLFGFMGFVYGTALSGLPPLIYYMWLQRRKGMLIARYEIYKFAFVVGVGMLTYLVGTLLMAVLPNARHVIRGA